MHVLAVSGLHLSLLLALGWWALRRGLGLSATAAYGLLLPLALLYLTRRGRRSCSRSWRWGACWPSASSS